MCSHMHINSRSNIIWHSVDERHTFNSLIATSLLCTYTPATIIQVSDDTTRSTVRRDFSRDGVLEVGKNRLLL